MTGVAAARGALRLTWDDPGTGDEREWYGVPPLGIGRAGDNEIVLNAEAVSRLHARLERDGDGVALLDLGSGNGTFVGGRRVTREALADGAVIAIGPFALTLDLDPGMPTVLQGGADDRPGDGPRGGGGVRGEAPRAGLVLRWSDPAGGGGGSWRSTAR